MLLVCEGGSKWGEGAEAACGILSMCIEVFMRDSIFFKANHSGLAWYSLQALFPV